MKEFLPNKKALLIVDFILLVIIILSYSKIYNKEIRKKIFEKQVVEFAGENEKPIFKIDKIILYSSAYAKDHSDDKLENIDISQFTDIAIYLNNKVKSEELSEENTISELSIKDISIDMNSENGEKILNYKSSKLFGKYVDIENSENNEINFNIVHKNEEKEEVQSNEFYTDCSNPITLGFVNKNIVTNARTNGENGTFTFDGRILKSANIKLQDISGKINFTIHLKNNYGEEFVTNCNINLEFNNAEKNIYNGYCFTMEEPEQGQNEFLKLPF